MSYCWTVFRVLVKSKRKLIEVCLFLLYINYHKKKREKCIKALIQEILKTEIPVFKPCLQPTFIKKLSQCIDREYYYTS